MRNIPFSARSLDYFSISLDTVICILKQLQYHKHYKRFWFPCRSSMFSNLVPGGLFRPTMLDQCFATISTFTCNNVGRRIQLLFDSLTRALRLNHFMFSREVHTRVKYTHTRRRMNKTVCVDKSACTIQETTVQSRLM